MANFQQGITLKALLENPDLLNPPKAKLDAKEKKDDFSELDNMFSGTSAFLGPNIWGKNDTLPYDVADLQLEYMDLDEFLNETGITQEEEDPSKSPSSSQPSTPQGGIPLQWSPSKQDEEVHSPQDEGRLSPQFLSPHASPRPASVDGWDGKRSPPHISMPSPAFVNAQQEHREHYNHCAKQRNVSSIHFNPSDRDLELAQIPGEEEFNPAAAKFSEDDLKPQPMIKKSKKVYVPEDLKDERYWNRRKKNNIAAKRSRDARRIKENQIAMRAAYLETENNQMKVDLVQIKEENDRLKAENEKLQAQLAKYEAKSAFV